MNEPEILTAEMLAARWGMDAKTLGNWRVQKKGPVYVKLGAGRGCKVLYMLDDVRAWEAAHRQVG